MTNFKYMYLCNIANAKTKEQRNVNLTVMKKSIIRTFLKALSKGESIHNDGYNLQ